MQTSGKRYMYETSFRDTLMGSNEFTYYKIHDDNSNHAQKHDEG